MYCVLELLIINDVYVICRLGGPYSELLCPRSQLFTIRNAPKPVNNLFIFSKLSDEKQTHEKKKLLQALL